MMRGGIVIKRTGVVAVLVAAGLALVGTGCEGHKAAGGPSAVPSPAGSPSPTAGPYGPYDGALVAYRGMWHAFVDAAKTSNPDASDLRTYASGQALRLIVGDLVTNRAQKKVVLGNLVINPSLAAVSPSSSPTQASIVDCVDDTHWLVYKASGGLYNNVPGGKHHTTATAKLTDGAWKVDSFFLDRPGTC